jgi:hypothetical protein
MAKPKLTKTMEAFAPGATLELKVTKSGGPSATVVEVGSTGTDDERFGDAALTPGPATKPLEAGNTYALLWVGAFVKAGKVTLRVTVVQPDGTTATTSRSVEGKKGGSFTRLLLLPS